jgi:hypothetical protein
MLIFNVLIMNKLIDLAEQINIYERIFFSEPVQAVQNIFKFVIRFSKEAL